MSSEGSRLVVGHQNVADGIYNFAARDVLTVHPVDEALVAAGVDVHNGDVIRTQKCAARAFKPNP